MKMFKTALHVLITLVSMLGFLLGWGTLAHSRKPVSSNQVSAASSLMLPPIPSFDDGSNFGGFNQNANGLQSLNPSPRRSHRSSALVTGGS